MKTSTLATRRSALAVSQEVVQAGFRTGAGVPWSDISRGMHREHSGQSCNASDERQMRAFWRQWQTLMSAW
jgi:benzoate/toluate 1,2-dioxygenase alpha subunit/p-cumate 2,3-dioxygenase alpha subunit